MPKKHNWFIKINTDRPTSGSAVECNLKKKKKKVRLDDDDAAFPLAELMTTQTEKPSIMNDVIQLLFLI